MHELFIHLLKKTKKKTNKKTEPPPQNPNFFIFITLYVSLYHIFLQHHIYHHTTPYLSSYPFCLVNRIADFKQKWKKKCPLLPHNHLQVKI